MAIDTIEEYDILDSVFGADENEPDEVNTDYRMPEEPMQDILARISEIILHLCMGNSIDELDVLDLMILEYALENDMIDFDMGALLAGASFCWKKMCLQNSRTLSLKA